MKSDPILNFRINARLQVRKNAMDDAIIEQSILPEAYQVVEENFQVTSQTTMITETREAVDSSEHA